MSWRDALINPWYFENAAPVALSSQNSAESDPPVTVDYTGAAARFELDPAAFMAAIEDPPPLFLQDTEADLQALMRLVGANG